MQLDEPTAAGLMYSDTGGDGPVVVLLHGVLMGGSLWDTVVAGLRYRYRCIVPELPFGAHTTPMPDNADLSLAALAPLIAEFLTELDLHHVTLVCNDWGGAQLVISPGGTDRVANLVLVSCEAFDNYPPGLPGRLLCRNAALPGGTFLTAQLLRPRWTRHLPLTFGARSKRRAPDDLFRSWLGPLRHISRATASVWRLRLFRVFGVLLPNRVTWYRSPVAGVVPCLRSWSTPCGVVCRCCGLTCVVRVGASRLWLSRSEPCSRE